MSDYHRTYMKLNDLLERGHRVQIDRGVRGYEVTVLPKWEKLDHEHTSGEDLSEVVAEAHRKALERWPKEDD